MNIQDYSTLPFILGDAALQIMEDATDNEEDSTVAYDIGDDQIAVFEVRYLGGNDVYLKESLIVGDDTYVDPETEGETTYDEAIELITHRLQMLDQVADKPRQPPEREKR